MFNKTRKRIYSTLMIIASVLIILIIAPSISAFSAMFYNTYKSMAVNKLDRSFSASRMFIDSVMSTTDNLALNPVIAETVSGTRTGSLTSVLDDACAYSLEINAVTVYSADGKIYTSSGVLNPPTVDELRRLQDIDEFFSDGEASEYVSLRTSGIIKAYGGTPYDEQTGIISCCRKIYGQNGAVTGYIFTDVFPKTLFAYYGFSGDPRLKNSIAMVTFDGGYFISESTEHDEDYLTAATQTTVKNRLIISSIRNFYGGTVRVAVPVAPLYENIALISCIIALCGIALLIGTHFVAKANADRVCARLNGLLLKMTASAQRFS